MKTYKITGKTNGYIASRDIQFNGKTEITIAEGLTLEQAIDKLEYLFLSDYGYYPKSAIISFDENEQPVFGIDDHWTEYSDGTASYEYDSRYYSITEEA